MQGIVSVLLSSVPSIVSNIYYEDLISTCSMNKLINDKLLKSFNKLLFEIDQNIQIFLIMILTYFNRANLTFKFIVNCNSIL